MPKTKHTKGRGRRKSKETQRAVPRQIGGDARQGTNQPRPEGAREWGNPFAGRGTYTHKLGAVRNGLCSGRKKNQATEKTLWPHTKPNVLANQICKKGKKKQIS